MPVEHAQLYFSFWSMQPAPAPRDRPFTLQDSPRYAGVRGVTGQKRSPARGLVTAAVAAREYRA